MKILTVTNPTYANADHTAIRCTVTFENNPGEYPYLAEASDRDSAEMFNEIASGKHGGVDDYTPAPPPLSALKAGAKSAVQVTAAALKSQMTSDPTHQTLMRNAAIVISGNAWAAPTTGPMSDAFNELAAGYGASPSEFAGIVLSTCLAELSLGSALLKVNKTIDAASDVEAMKAAIKTFDDGMPKIVEAVNAGLINPISKPERTNAPGLSE